MKTTHAQRELVRATEMLRRPGARLILMHTNRREDRATMGRAYFVVPGGQISKEIAEKLIARPDVCGGEDGLFPGHDQTWRFA